MSKEQNNLDKDKSLHIGGGRRSFWCKIGIHKLKHAQC